MRSWREFGAEGVGKFAVLFPVSGNELIIGRESVPKRLENGRFYLAALEVDQFRRLVGRIRAKPEE